MVKGNAGLGPNLYQVVRFQHRRDVVQAGELEPAGEPEHLPRTVALVSGQPDSSAVIIGGQIAVDGG